MKLTVRAGLFMLLIGVALAGLIMFCLPSVGFVSNMVANNAAAMLDRVTTQAGATMKLTLELLFRSVDYAAGVFTAAEDVRNPGIRAQMDVLLATQPDIVSVVLLSDSGALEFASTEQPLKPTAKATEQSWFQNATRPGYLSAPHVQNLFQGRHDWVISISRRISFQVDGQRQTGVLLTDIRFDSIRAACQSAQPGSAGYLYIVTPAQEIVFHPKQQLLFMGVREEDIGRALSQRSGVVYRETQAGREQMVMPVPLGTGGWTMVGVSYMDDVSRARAEILSRLVLILAVVVPLILLISVLSAHRVTLPLRRITRQVEQVERGDLQVWLHEVGFMEIEQLSSGINAMVSSIRRLMESTIHRQEALRRAEVDALAAQITPHFLNNTLDTAVRMMEAGKSDVAIRMIENLARLFRLSIASNASCVPLRDEIEHARCYLAIQALRREQAFRTEFEIAPETENLSCPRLILQPIVENSIRHGISTLSEGVIRVSANVQDERLEIRVWDNGIGIEGERLARLRAALLRPDAAKPGAHGVALPSVHQRIALLYGEGYGLTIESEEDAYTCVIVRLPRLPA